MTSETLALLGGPKAFNRNEELSHASRWPLFGEEEKAAVMETLDSADVYTPIGSFEQEFAAYQGSRFALAQCNGTSTIHAAYFAVGVEPGDEVITSAYTWHLQVSQILTLHAIPVFCDVDPVNACIDPGDIERKLSLRTKAIAVVHPFGAIAPMDEITRIARKHGLPVIEDCSHAHGALYKGRKVGTLGDIGCFSLQAGKLMTCIEGGVLVTDNEEYYERACLLGHYERVPKLRSAQLRKYYDPEKTMAPTSFGFKYRMHPLAAAMARVQLGHLDEWNAERRRYLMYLTEHLSGIAEGFDPPHEEPGTQRTWLNFICQYYQDRMEDVPRERFIEALNAEGLPASGGRTGYLPIYWNPLYEERNMWAKGCPFDAPYVTRKVTFERGICPQAEAYWQRTVGLPILHRQASQELLDQIVEAVAKAVRNIALLRKQ